MRTYQSFLLSAVSLLCVTNGDEECEWSSESTGVSFDLSRLELDGQQLAYYTVSDERADVDDPMGAHNFTYVFNVCNTVMKKPNVAACKSGKHETCTSFTSAGDCAERVNISAKAFAYQINRKQAGTQDDKCYIIGGTQVSDMSFSLWSETNPAAGVTMTYDNGEYCGGTVKKNRRMVINWICDNDEYNIPDEERVTEPDNECLYSISVKSIYGCPTECGTYSNALCGADGVCDYDWTNHKAQCFCYWGWQGTACEETSRFYGTEYKGGSKKTHPDEQEEWVDTFTYFVEDKDKDGKDRSREVDATYDLQWWHLGDGKGHFYVNDTDQDFYYLLNLFGNVDKSSVPDSCKIANQPCDFDADPNCLSVELVGDDLKGSIFQISHDGTKCHLAGRYASSTDAAMHALEHATEGTTVKYTKGGYCANENVNRQFEIKFVCPDSNRTYYSPTNELTISATVDESDACSYFLTIESAYACPWECLDTSDSSKFTVCGAQGICAGDPWAETVRCLCDDGFKGELCTEKASSSSSSGHDDSGLIAAIVIFTILFVAFLVATIYLYMRNRSLQKYGAQFLDDEPDDVVNPPFHTEPKVPDDLVDSESEADSEDAGIQEVQIEMRGTSATSESDDGVGVQMPDSPLRSEYERENETLT